MTTSKIIIQVANTKNQTGRLGLTSYLGGSYLLSRAVLKQILEGSLSKKVKGELHKTTLVSKYEEDNLCIIDHDAHSRSIGEFLNNIWEILQHGGYSYYFSTYFYKTDNFYESDVESELPSHYQDLDWDVMVIEY